MIESNYQQIRSIFDVESELNNGVRMCESDRGKCVEWLTKYMIHNKCSVSKMYELCVHNPEKVYERIFGNGDIDKFDFHVNMRGERYEI